MERSEQEKHQIYLQLFVLLGRNTGLVEAGQIVGILPASMETCSQLEILEYVGQYDQQGLQVYSENALK